MGDHHERHLDDSEDFRLMLNVNRDEQFIQFMPPHQMDRLGIEISAALQRCAVPESQVSDEERKTNEIMMETFSTIDDGLTTRAEISKDGQGSALLKLYERIVITSRNLQGLFRMCDTNIRTGHVRCKALTFLNIFGVNLITWKLQVPGDGDDESPVSFGVKQITVMSNVVAQNYLCDNPCGQGPCEVCTQVPWMSLNSALTKARDSERPVAILQVLRSYDWPTILHRPNVYIHKDEECEELTFYDMDIFWSLHHWACRVLADDRESTNAKTFLKEKLGSCHELLRTVLKRLISGELNLPINSQDGLDTIAPIAVAFLHQIINCLVPLPIDRETRALVRRARTVLREPYRNAISSPTPGDLNKRNIIKAAGTVLFAMDNWQLLHDLTDEQRWVMFHESYLPGSGDNVEEVVKKYIKELRQQHKEEAQAWSKLPPEGEACANCFTLEKTILDESNQTEGLQKCSKCRQIKYCSRQCQVEHWKKIHRKQCKHITATINSGGAGD